MDFANYEEGVIYKIYCKDPSVKNFYIGSTVDFHKRKIAHKTSYNNENCKSHNLLLYNFIRDNGGWDNWNIEIIEKIKFIYRTELREKEKFWIEKEESSLNVGIILTKEEREKKKEEKKQYQREYQKKYIEKYKKLKN